METKFTPGKWSIGRCLTNTGAIPIRAPRNASKPDYPHCFNVAWACCKDTDNNFDPKETLANARLIAAAPLLYEACNQVVREMECLNLGAHNGWCIEKTPDDLCPVCQCAAAIAAAESE